MLNYLTSIEHFYLSRKGKFASWRKWEFVLGKIGFEAWLYFLLPWGIWASIFHFSGGRGRIWSILYSRDNIISVKMLHFFHVFNLASKYLCLNHWFVQFSILNREKLVWQEAVKANSHNSSKPWDNNRKCSSLNGIFITLFPKTQGSSKKRRQREWEKWGGCCEWSWTWRDLCTQELSAVGLASQISSTNWGEVDLVLS